MQARIDPVVVGLPARLGGSGNLTLRRPFFEVRTAPMVCNRPDSACQPTAYLGPWGCTRARWARRCAGSARTACPPAAFEQLCQPRLLLRSAGSTLVGTW